MTRGQRKHLKRLNAPTSWRLNKTAGKYATMPSHGPHAMRDCIPLCILIRKKLNLASSEKELSYILSKKSILVNGVVRTDKSFPLGVMDILTIQTTNEHYRVLYDTVRKFILQKVEDEESNIRLCKVTDKKVLKKQVPLIYTKDGSSFRYCDPKIKKGDTVVVDIKEKKVIGCLPFANDMRVFVTKGKNTGCVGFIASIEKHDGGSDIVHIQDVKGRNFSTKAVNTIIIGDQEKAFITLPKEEGVKMSELEKSNERFGGPIIEGKKVLVEEE